MNDLDHYFAQARSRPQSIPFEQVAELLNADPPPGTGALGHDSTSLTKTKTIMTSIVLSLLAVAAGIGIATNGPAADAVAPNTHVAQTHRAFSPPAPAGLASAAPAVAPRPQSAHVIQPAALPASAKRAVALRTDPKHDGDTPVHLPVDVSGVKVIELSGAELALLGARADTAGVWVFTREGGEESAVQVSMSGIGYSSDGPTAASLGITPLPTFPTLVTDDRGMWRMMSYDPDSVDPALSARINELPVESAERAELQAEMSTKANDYVKATMNSLLPILIRTGRVYTEADSAARRWRPDCILWVRPTSEIVARLPEPIRARIAAELASVGSVTDLPIRTVPGEQPYLDLLRTTSGAIQRTTLHPNPTREHAVVDYQVAQARNVNVTLHSIDGELIRPLVEGRSVEAGDGSIALDFGALRPGVYLIALTTDRGERVVQRLVIQK